MLSTSNSLVRGVQFAGLFAEKFGRVHDGDAEEETHEETANVGEVVETGEETEGEGEDDLDSEDGEFFSGTAALFPRVD